MALVGNPVDWAATTKQGVIRDAILSQSGAVSHEARKCAVCTAAWRELVPSLGTGELRFYTYPGGVKTELPHGRDRSRKLRNLTHEIHAYMGGEPTAPAPFVEPVAEPEPEPAAPKAPTALSEAHKTYLRRVREIRAFAEDRDIDHISYRPIKDGARMIAAGIPVDACLYAMTLHWEDADRRQAGIRTYDPAKEFPGGMARYLEALVNAGVLIYLFGPAGMGKSFWCEELADRLSVDFGFTPMTEGATPSWLLGKVDLQGFKPTKLLDIWVNGGVYLFDEIDAADPNMMLVLNGPLANNRLENPVDQTTYTRSPKCIIIAAANTLGTGADAAYNARNQLDFSTLDRFRMGRAFVGYNASVEEMILVENAAPREDMFAAL